MVVGVLSEDMKHDRSAHMVWREISSTGKPSSEGAETRLKALLFRSCMQAPHHETNQQTNRAGSRFHSTAADLVC